jgi:TPR repeat protein
MPLLCSALLYSGNRGAGDEAVQLLAVRAEEGDAAALQGMGDLHYFGARGLPRDQARALRLYDRAAGAGSLLGACCAAAMYLKVGTSGGQAVAMPYIA